MHAQAVNSNMDELPASHFMDAADGVSILDPSIHCNQINVDWLFNLKGKGALEDGTAFVSKRIKAIKLTDKSKLVGFWSMNIYLTSSDDKNKMFQAERRVERKAAIRISSPAATSQFFNHFNPSMFFQFLGKLLPSV